VKSIFLPKVKKRKAKKVKNERLQLFQFESYFLMVGGIFLSIRVRPNSKANKEKIMFFFKIICSLTYV